MRWKNSLDASSYNTSFTNRHVLLLPTSEPLHVKRGRGSACGLFSPHDAVRTIRSNHGLTFASARCTRNVHCDFSLTVVVVPRTAHSVYGVSRKPMRYDMIWNAAWKRQSRQTQSFLTWCSRRTLGENCGTLQHHGQSAIQSTLSQDLQRTCVR